MGLVGIGYGVVLRMNRNRPGVTHEMTDIVCYRRLTARSIGDEETAKGGPHACDICQALHYAMKHLLILPRDRKLVMSAMCDWVNFSITL